MPKLTDAQATAASESEVKDFSPLPDGRYEVKLVKVTTSAKPGASGHHYWECEFVVDQDGVRKAKLWTNVSLAPDAAFRVKEFFTALGFTLDSDTDEMIGERCIAGVVTEVQEQGKNAGKERNAISYLTALDE